MMELTGGADGAIGDTTELAREPRVDYNPFDPAVIHDPYPAYAWLRESAPLYHNQRLGFWALSRHADVCSALRDHIRFSSRYGVNLEQWGPDARAVMSFIAMDPPDHTRLRRLISAAFTPRRVAAMEPAIRAWTRQRLRQMLERRHFDFVGDFAVCVPVAVISDLSGVPVADRDWCRRMSEEIMTRDSGLQVPPAAAEAGIRLAAYYTELVADRRKRPRDDLATALLQVQQDGARLSDEEVAAALVLLGVAGNETTARLLGNAWHAAWAHPTQRKLGFAGQVDGWVEETLRWDGPSQYVARLVTQDVPVYGRTVPAGDRMLLLFSAADRDPRVFARPDEFDLTRDTRAAIAFGTGPHYCLGASLARLQARTILDEVIQVVETDFDIDLDAARRSPNATVRGFAELPTTITGRRQPGTRATAT